MNKFYFENKPLLHLCFFIKNNDKSKNTFFKVFFQKQIYTEVQSTTITEINKCIYKKTNN